MIGLRRRPVAEPEPPSPNTGLPWRPLQLLKSGHVERRHHHLCPRLVQRAGVYDLFMSYGLGMKTVPGTCLLRSSVLADV